MKSLRLRIAAILISAIVVVVIVATTIIILLSSRADPQRMVGPVASQIIAINNLYTQGKSQSQGLVHPVGALGPERDDLTAALEKRLERAGVPFAVTVYDKSDDDTQVAVVNLGGERIGIDFPTSLPVPTEVWLALGTWLALVVLGVIAVSLWMAYRVTEPFAILEKAVGSIGPDGILPHIPESGSGEARQTAAVLNRLSDRLKSAMESRMRLVAAAGHDLRTPMTCMRIRAEFLNDQDRDSWLKDLDELELIADSAIRLVREEAGGGDQASLVPLRELLVETVDDLRAQHHSITLTKADASDVNVPYLAMKRALRNLLINAATHGKGGCVSLRVDGARTVLRVEDDGPGIPEELLERVFEPFFRAEPGRVQTVPGAGLGLAIAKEIIERQGATLSIRNGASKGLVQEIVFTH